MPVSLAKALPSRPCLGCAMVDGDPIRSGVGGREGNRGKVAVGTVPPQVMEAAQTRRFGDLVAAQRNYHRLTYFLMSIALAAAFFAAAYGLGLVTEQIRLRALAFLGVVFLLLFVLSLLGGIVALFGRRRAAFLFSDGLVCLNGRDLEAVEWSAVARLLVMREGRRDGGPGRVKRYVIESASGGKVIIPTRLQLGDSEEPLYGVLVHLLQGRGCTADEIWPRGRRILW